MGANRPEFRDACAVQPFRQNEPFVKRESGKTLIESLDDFPLFCGVQPVGDVVWIPVVPGTRPEVWGWAFASIALTISP